jgi:hypothetical protein
VSKKTKEGGPGSEAESHYVKDKDIGNPLDKNVRNLNLCVIADKFVDVLNKR